MTERPSGPKPLTLLLLPIAVVASLVGLRAIAQGIGGADAGTPDAAVPADGGAEPLAGPVDVGAGQPDGAVASGDEAGAGGGDEEAADEAAAKIPSIADLGPYPEAEDLLARAALGDDGRYWSNQGGKRVALTLDAELQGRLDRLLALYRPPFASIVALDPSTGRVLALAQYSKAEPDVHALGLRAVYPAASVFKVVTAAALLEHGVDPSQAVCFHGGRHRLREKLLADSPRDHRCYDMGEALAKSANVVFAKLAARHLTPAALRAEAAKFGFNRPLAFDQPIDASEALIPDAPFPFATTAAGFGQVFLSPLHGALLAATVADRGAMPSPFLIDDGTPPAKPQQVVGPKIADRIAEMMVRTVTSGTARRAFRERGRPVMKGIEIAGKTGSLDDHHPFHDYTWFVGFAPRDRPQIAVAAVVVNSLVWRVRAPYLAREAMRYFLEPMQAGAEEKPSRRVVGLR